jgi:hypothetical protein
MKKLLITILFTSNLVYASSYGNMDNTSINSGDLDDVVNQISNCKKGGGKIINSPAVFDTAAGHIKGISYKMCYIEKIDPFNKKPHSAMIGLEVMGKVQSIAATYLLKGINFKNFPQVTSNNPAHDTCKFIGGSVISTYAFGGFENEQGEDSVCVFGDGSKLSTWALIYISQNPLYLGIRSSLGAKPLDIDAPYLGNGLPSKPSWM